MTEKIKLNYVKAKDWALRHKKDLITGATIVGGALAAAGVWIFATEMKSEKDGDTIPTLRSLSDVAPEIVEVAKKSQLACWRGECEGYTMADLGKVGNEALEAAAAQKIDIRPDTKINGILIYTD
jgi:hypothetical protein